MIASLSRLTVLGLCALAGLWIPVSDAFAQIDFEFGARTPPTTRDLDLEDAPPRSSAKDSYIDEFESRFNHYFFDIRRSGAYGSRDFLLQLARDMKNLAVLIAVIYLFVGVFMILFSNGTEDDLKKWRANIIWTTVAIVIMQSAYSIAFSLYGRDIGRAGGYSAYQILVEIVNPFTSLLQTLASFLFLGFAFYSFFRITFTSQDNEEAKKGRVEIFYAILGFIIVKVSEVLVVSIYGRPDEDCSDNTFFRTSRCMLEDPDLSGTIRIAVTIINFFNSFISIAIVLLIVYAGFLVLTSAGNEDRLQKAKNILLYIAIGVLLLVASYAVFNFFLLRDTG